MKTPNKERELVLLSKKAFLNEEALEKELTSLENIFDFTESLESFSLSHELVKRNRITKKFSVLENIYYRQALRPFNFLICRN